MHKHTNIHECTCTQMHSPTHGTVQTQSVNLCVSVQTYSYNKSVLSSWPPMYSPLNYVSECCLCMCLFFFSFINVILGLHELFLVSVMRVLWEFLCVFIFL